MNKNYMKIYLLLEQLKQQSECLDKQVACIITDLNYNILSIGINEIVFCNKECDKTCEVVHAETNTIFSTNKAILGCMGYYAFINLFPCENCQRALQNNGIQKIISFAPKHKKQIFKDIEIVTNISDILLAFNGKDRQLNIIIGELSELIGSITNHFNKRNFLVKDKSVEKVLDEIIDVELMLIQLKKILFKEDKEVYNKLRSLQEAKYLKLLEGLNSF